MRQSLPTILALTIATKHEVIMSTIARKSSTSTIIAALVVQRKRQKLTQAVVAERMETTASAVARLESCGGKKQHSPSVRTLEKYAGVLNCKIEIKLIPLDNNNEVHHVDQSTQNSELTLS